MSHLPLVLFKKLSKSISFVMILINDLILIIFAQNFKIRRAVKLWAKIIRRFKIWNRGSSICFEDFSISFLSFYFYFFLFFISFLFSLYTLLLLPTADASLSLSSLPPPRASAPPLPIHAGLLSSPLASSRTTPIPPCSEPAESSSLPPCSRPAEGRQWRG